MTIVSLAGVSLAESRRSGRLIAREVLARVLLFFQALSKMTPAIGAG